MSQKNLDFDTIIDRRHTSCGKWDTMDQKYGSVDLIHLGVADMDFPSPQPIIDSFQKCLDHGIFG
ncbi:MAG TPA: pyridoxal phosphate-dependent aminotransferase, partial [Candidatus Blautia pullicola]|nr:pyridoxal phosphate-dependent aminotransferase [Candidatus Blautia pullicola]